MSPPQQTTYEFHRWEPRQPVVPTPPSQWPNNFAGRAPEAIAQPFIQHNHRQVHTPPPYLAKEPITVSPVVNRTPHVPQMPVKCTGPHVQRPRRYLKRSIYFCEKSKPYYGFTNFSDHAVIYEGKRYPTSEHLYQSMKFAHKPRIAEHIRTCSTLPRVAFNEAHKFQSEVRPDWIQVNIQVMDFVLWHKFTQHHDLKRQLLSTGNANLIEDSKVDSFWGIGANGSGRNELGKALERLRDHLRA